MLPGHKTRIVCTIGPASASQAVKPGDALYLNDGIIQLELLSVAGNDVACRVVVGGELRSHKGLTFPTSTWGWRCRSSGSP